MPAVETRNLTDARTSSPITSAIGGLILRYKKYRLYRKTILELESLSDRELLDFGIKRFAIDQVARESVYGV